MNGRDAELRELVNDLAALTPTAIEAQLVELGLLGIDVPERDGGSGGSLADLLVIVEEFATRGVSSSLIDASCAHWLTTRCGQKVDLSVRSTIKLLPDGAWNETGRHTIMSVPWAREATRILTVDAAGRVQSLDTTAATIEHVDNVAGEPRDTVTVSTDHASEIGRVDVNSLACRLGLLRSAALLGAATGVYRITRQHVAERHQFGAPLNRIPAVATQLAVLKTLVLQMQTSLNRAKETYERTGPENAFAAVAIARVTVTSSAGEVARIGHQLHGAIGTTEEHQLHRYTRPLWAWRDDDGLPRYWQEFVGQAAMRDGEPSIWDELTAPA